MMLIPGTKSLNARQMVRSPSDAIGSTTSATVCSWSRVVKRRGSSLRDIIHVHLTCTHTSATVTHTRWSECAVADDASHHRWGFLCPHSPIRDSQTITCQRPGTHTHTHTCGGGGGGSTSVSSATVMLLATDGGNKQWCNQ